MTNEQLVQHIFAGLGGQTNIVCVTNCMTRLRIQVREDNKIQEDALCRVEGVLGVVHDRTGYLEVVVGPGKSRKCADLCAARGIPTAAAPAVSTEKDWHDNKAAWKAGQENGRIRSMLKTFGEIFVPLLPGVIAAGLCSGLATLLTQVYPGYADNAFWSIVYNLLSLINASFMTYLTAWAGYRAAERFGATPILGGMLGMMTTLGNIDSIAKVLDLYNEAQPLDAVLRAGRGGVLAVVLGVWVLARIEKAVRRRIPDNLDIMFTPPDYPGVVCCSVCIGHHAADRVCILRFVLACGASLHAHQSPGAHPGRWHFGGAVPAHGGHGYASRPGGFVYRPAGGTWLCHAVSGAGHGRCRPGGCYHRHSA